MDAYVASELRGHSAQGQTVPLYLGCRVEGSEIVYQSKLAGRRSGLSTRELGVELLGTAIAHEVGLHVAPPAMVTLTPWTIERVEREYRFGIEDATAFGTRWKAGLTPYLPDVELDLLSEATCATLLALDLVLTNGDRTEPNPNVCWDGERLLVFDFEHCLELPKIEFLRRVAVHRETLGPTLETHLMAPCVGKRALLSALERVLDLIPVGAFVREAFALPSSWRHEWLDNVEYLGYLRSEPETILDRILTLSP